MLSHFFHAPEFGATLPRWSIAVSLVLALTSMTLLGHLPDPSRKSLPATAALATSSILERDTFLPQP